jgi:AAA+ superfamily predicted ATPase
MTLRSTMADDLSPLMAAVRRLRDSLGRHIEGADEPDAEAAEGAAVPPALALIAERFGLSRFETDLLLLAVGVELDPELAVLCGRAQGRQEGALPTFGLALAVLPGGHWNAIASEAPLRYWRLLELGPGDMLSASPLRADERVLLHLTGVPQLDRRLPAYLDVVPEPGELVESHQRLAGQIAGVWLARGPDSEPPVVCVAGGDAGDRRAIVGAACALAGLRLYEIGPHALTAVASELEEFSRLCRREAVLGDGALLVTTDLDGVETQRADLLDRFVRHSRVPVVVSGPRWRPGGREEAVTFDVPAPDVAEQRAAWERALGASFPADHLVAQFRLGPAAVQEVCTEAATIAAASGAGDAGGADLEPVLWEVCRRRARPRVDGLAQRVPAAASWDDLVVPEPQRRALRAIVRHVRYRLRVHHDWGFGKSSRGLGVGALFAGPSGTGKTMAAEVLAAELGLDLYRVDLSGVVSKYIGETEKSLGRVFDAVEGSGTVLLFDEADALFGRRSEVRDSHDRYANIEVSYLLQRMESYNGLAILTTNLADAVDTAFLRRLRFVVRFPFPDAAQRAEIWRRSFPAGTPTRGLDPETLATLQVAGGSIRNIALGAAFHAAEADAPVDMSHVLAAALEECDKHQRQLAPAEIQGWT